MRLVETLVQNLNAYLQSKKVLEIACGDSYFSLCASKYAKEVLATDISLERVNRKNLNDIPINITFEEMDATNLDIKNNSFDVSVCYNALGHLDNVLKFVLKEMIRVTIHDGYLMFIATWKMDKRIIPELKNIINEHTNIFIYSEIENSKYTILVLKKTI